MYIIIENLLDGNVCIKTQSLQKMLFQWKWKWHKIIHIIVYTNKSKNVNTYTDTHKVWYNTSKCHRYSIHEIPSLNSFEQPPICHLRVILYIEFRSSDLWTLYTKPPIISTIGTLTICCYMLTIGVWRFKIPPIMSTISTVTIWC